MPTLTAALLASAVPAVAARADVSPAPAPKPWLEGKIKEAKKLADRRTEPGTPAAEAWQKDAQAFIDELVDWDAMISRSLGSKWDDLKPAQRERFSSLLRQLIRASFQSKLRLALEERDEKPGRVSIEWLEEDVEPDEATLLARVTAERRRVDLEVDLNRHDDRWKMADLTIDGAGTVRMYRSSFRQVMRDEGWDGLIARLEQKLEDVEAGRADFVPGGGPTDEGPEKKK
jgi:phospholipid transport system substrate-binding protein